MGKGTFNGLLPDPLSQPCGHKSLLIHIGERFIKGLFTSPALVTAGIDMDTHSFAMHGQVPDKLLPSAKAYKTTGIAMRAKRRVFSDFSIDMIVMVGIIDFHDAVSR